MYIHNGVFDWNPIKASSNYQKHGVRFEEAITVFSDPNALDGPDVLHSGQEVRFLRIGLSDGGHLLTVAYTFRRIGDETKIRIISARKASRKERRFYKARD
jgi:uncharacterized protein